MTTKPGLCSCQDSDSTSTPVCPIYRCFIVCVDQSLTDSDASARELYANAIEKRLFVDLDLERRSEVCTILLQTGGEGGEAVSKCALDIFYDCSSIAFSTWHPECSLGSFSETLR